MCERGVPHTVWKIPKYEWGAADQVGGVGLGLEIRALESPAAGYLPRDLGRMAEGEGGVTWV